MKTVRVQCTILVTLEDDVACGLQEGNVVHVTDVEIQWENDLAGVRNVSIHSADVVASVPATLPLNK